MSGLGIIANETKDFNKAIKYLEKALEIDPDYSEAYNSVAVAFRKKKNYESAFKNAYKAIELNPQNGFAYSTLAEMYADNGNEDEFYRNTELALIFGGAVEDFVKDESYKPYLNEPKFQKLLEKYTSLKRFNLSAEL